LGTAAFRPATAAGSRASKGSATANTSGNALASTGPRTDRQAILG